MRAVAARRRRQFRALVAAGHSAHEARQYLYLDCASEIDICAESEAGRAVRSEHILTAQQPIIGGTNLGSPLRATTRHWFYVLGKLTPFVTGPGSRWNILSTMTSAKLGYNTVVSAPRGELWLAPAGDSLDNPVHQVMAIPVGKLWALPGGLRSEPTEPVTLASPVLGTEDQLQRDRVSGDTTTTPSTHAEDQPADDKGTTSAASKRVDAMWFRAILGNPSTRSIRQAASKVREEVTVPDDKATSHYCDRLNRTANGKALGMKAVPPSADEPQRLQIVGDTCGSAQHQARGTRAKYFQSWVLLARDNDGNTHIDDIYVTFSEDNKSASSLRGFTQMCQEAGLTVHRDAVSQAIEIITDQGKEYLGAFLEGMQRAGIKVSTSTAHSTQKGLVGYAESANAVLQQTGRSTSALAQPNFEHHKLEVIDFWDRAVQHGALQRRWLRRVLRGTASYAQVLRKVGAPFGARGEVGLMLTGTERTADHRGKQFAKRMIPAIFLGMTDDGKAVMIESGGKIHETMHVRFGADAMPAIPAPVTGTVLTNHTDDAGGHHTGPITTSDHDAADTTTTPVSTTPASTTATVTPAARPGTRRRAKRTHINKGASAAAPAGTTATAPPAARPRRAKRTHINKGASAAAPAGTTATAPPAARPRRQRRAKRNHTGSDANTEERAVPPAQRQQPARGQAHHHGKAHEPAGSDGSNHGDADANGKSPNASGTTNTVLPKNTHPDRHAATAGPRQSARHRNPSDETISTDPTTRQPGSTAGDTPAQAASAAGEGEESIAVNVANQAGPRRSARHRNQSASDIDEVTPTDSTTKQPSSTADDTPAQAASEVEAEEDSFIDNDGNTVKVGDHISMKWPGQGTYDGIIIAIQIDPTSADGGAYAVAYADDTEEWHAIRGGARIGARNSNLKASFFSSPAPSGLHHHDSAERAGVQRDMDRLHRQAHATHDPHDSPRVYRTMRSTVTRPANPAVVQFIDHDTGDIRRDLIEGVEEMPATPELPDLPKSAEPPAPSTINEALASELAEHWLPAILKELGGHRRPTNRPPTYTYTTARSDTKQQLYVKWVFVIKRHADGSIDKFKARAVLAGHWLKRGIDYVESYSGSSPWSDVLDLESLSVNLRLRNYEADLSQAYMFAAMPPAPNGKPVIAVMSAGARTYDASGQQQNLLVQQCWYGHPVSGFGLARTLHDRLINRNLEPGQKRCPVPFEQCPTQPVIFRAAFPTGHKHHGEIFWLHITTDNLRSYTSNDEIQSEFMDFLDSVFVTTGGRTALQDLDPLTFHGVRFAYGDDGVHMDMPAYIDELLEETGLRHATPSKTTSPSGYQLSKHDMPSIEDRQQVIQEVNKMFPQQFTTYDEVIKWYGHIVSSLGWITQKVGPSMQQAHSVLCRAIAAPGIQAFRGAKHLLRYLTGKQDMYRAYYPHREYDWRNGDLPEWSIMTDASYADDLYDRRSQGGYVGGFEGRAVTTTHSGKSPRVLLSTYQAESSFAARACKEAEYKRNLFRFLRVLKAGPTKLYVDNYATFRAAGAQIRKWSPASKQFNIEEKYVVECGERGIIEVHHKPGSLPENPQRGDGFVADTMTKTMTARQMDFYYPELHGDNSNPKLHGDNSYSQSFFSRSVTPAFYTSRGGEQRQHWH